MIHKLRDWWRGEIIRAVLMAPMACVAVVLPLDFLSQIDSHLMNPRPWELLTVFAWTWIIYALLGFTIGMTAIVPSLVAARLMRKSPAVWANRAGTWLSVTLISLGLLRTGKVWLAANGFAVASWLSQAKWALAAVVGAGCAVWVWRRSTLPVGMARLMRLSTACGLILVVISPLAAWWAAPTRLAELSGFAGCEVVK